VSRPAYPDPSQFDRKSDYYDAKSTPENPRWDLVDVEFVAKVERFNPATGIWEKLAPMSTPRGGPGVVTTHGRIFVVGGATGEFGPHHEPLTSSEVFDGHAWHPLDALLPVGRSSLCAERAPGNRILAIGGFEPADPGSTVPSTRVEGLRGGQQ